MERKQRPNVTTQSDLHAKQQLPQVATLIFGQTMNARYKVFVDDNYRYMDEGERYQSGSYDSLEEALEKCEELLIRSLKDLYEKGMTPDELCAQWAMFGEDPFIGGADGSVPFSARNLINVQLCEAVIKSIPKVGRD